jgi:ABC-type uncharacterized transport system permease subunit
MDTLIVVLKVLLPVAYFICLWFYGRLFFSADEAKQSRRATLSLGFALAVHGGLLFSLAARFQRCPLWTQGEALLFLALLLAAVHLISEWSADTRRLGFFTLGPAAICAAAGLAFLGRNLTLSADYRSSWFIFHIVASLAAYAVFSLAAVLAALYLTLHRKLKHKTFDRTFRKLPPLEKLDKLSAMWAFLGTLLMLVSSVIGAWWVRRDTLKGMSPREIGIFVVLAIYLTAAATRRGLGWRGRRHALWIWFWPTWPACTVSGFRSALAGKGTAEHLRPGGQSFDGLGVAARSPVSGRRGRARFRGNPAPGGRPP